MNRKFLFVTMLTLAMFTLLPTIAPAFSAPPTKGTYTQVIVDHTIDPGEEFQTGDILHIRGVISESYLYGGPLGNSISGSGTAKGEINLVSFSGTWIGHTAETYAAGTVEGMINVKFTGVGPYVYLGPTFTFTLGGVTATLTTGDVFAGLLYDIMTVKHGTGDLAGFTLKGIDTAVSVMDVIFGDPNMVGMAISFETGRYSW